MRAIDEVDTHRGVPSACSTFPLLCVSVPLWFPSSLPEQRRHLLAQQRDLLVRLAEVREQPQVITADGAAGQQPGPHAEQLVQLHELAVADEDAVLAHQRLDEALELAEDVGREEGVAVGLLVALAAALALAEQV